MVTRLCGEVFLLVSSPSEKDLSEETGKGLNDAKRASNMVRIDILMDLLIVLLILKCGNGIVPDYQEKTLSFWTLTAGQKCEGRRSVNCKKSLALLNQDWSQVPRV